MRHSRRAHGHGGVGQYATGPNSYSHKDGLGDLLVGGPYLACPLGVAVNAIGALGDMGAGQGNELFSLDR